MVMGRQTHDARHEDWSTGAVAVAGSSERQGEWTASPEEQRAMILRRKPESDASEMLVCNAELERETKMQPRTDGVARRSTSRRGPGRRRIAIGSRRVDSSKRRHRPRTVDRGPWTAGPTLSAPHCPVRLANNSKKAAAKAQLSRLKASDDAALPQRPATWSLRRSGSALRIADSLCRGCADICIASHAVSKAETVST
ncbi:uncharacterized protein PSANT_06655 [Moesziomyces antarcticus]|uniref:Uncharacterized protein n=1 Tax=Pseudozyma antarctica TaxID=84753 RepID=A0A5C3FX67_PSEA2|nr:uncharacterized protein PSANT_06655 [Moesziomyces antarcticus]